MNLTKRRVLRPAVFLDRDRTLIANAADTLRGGGVVAFPTETVYGLGMLSPTTADHVRHQLGGQVDVILDGGPCTVGVESTIVSFCGTRPTLLRPGGITTEDLEAVLGPLVCPAPHEPVPLAPGRLPRHYAPRTPLVLCVDCSPWTPRCVWSTGFKRAIPLRRSYGSPVNVTAI
jgi:L-threonylcarbamoyladenylate synthase